MPRAREISDASPPDAPPPYAARDGAQEYRDLADDYDGDATIVAKTRTPSVDAEAGAADRADDGVDDVTVRRVVAARRRSADVAAADLARDDGRDFDRSDASSDPSSIDPSEFEPTGKLAPIGARALTGTRAAPSADSHAAATGSALHWGALHWRDGAPDALLGRRIAGRYVLIRVLGEGGMGTVFEAEHIELGKRVAIKVLSSLFVRHDEATARFLREARAASAIVSEHIVQVFDVGEDPAVGPYMVMELLRGDDLANVVKARGRLRFDVAAGVVAQICLALERAHAAGIIHRDLKPANVFLARSDDGSTKVKVLDFGIAKLVRDVQRARGAGLTRMGTAIGTPQYMSPEQAQGMSSVDHRTDVYSLGAVLYEILVGCPAYPELESYEQTIVLILSRAAPRVSTSVPNVPPELDRLVAQMMANSPAGRPRSVTDVRMRLLELFPGVEDRRLMLDPSASHAVRFRSVPAQAPRESGSGARETASRRALAPGRWRTAAMALAVLAFGVALGGVLRAPKGPLDRSAAAFVAGARGSEDDVVREANRALASGANARALDLATSATARYPASADAWLALGAAYEAAGDRAAAQRAYRACGERAAGARVHECVALTR